jgi:hypothetical protein
VGERNTRETQIDSEVSQSLSDASFAWNVHRPESHDLRTADRARETVDHAEQVVSDARTGVR